MRCYCLLCGAYFILIAIKTDNYYISDNEQYVLYNFFYVIILRHITLQYFLYENISMSIVENPIYENRKYDSIQVGHIFIGLQIGAT